MTLTFSRVTLAAPLWTVDEAKVHLHITGTDHDADITQKRDAAQEAILAFLGPAGDATWTAATAPQAVKHAIHLLTAQLYDHRGDDDSDSFTKVWAAIVELLGPYRDPTVA